MQFIFTYKLSVSNNKIKIYWDYVIGASNYTIYRSNSKNGKYKAIKTVTSNYLIDSNLKKGKTYYYYV